MIQEYLFSDKTQQNKLIQYRPNNVDCEITDFENSDCWMATYTVPHEDEYAAKALSDVNEYVMWKVLTPALRTAGNQYSDAYIAA